MVTSCWIGIENVPFRPSLRRETTPHLNHHGTEYRGAPAQESIDDRRFGNFFLNRPSASALDHRDPRMAFPSVDRRGVAGRSTSPPLPPCTLSVTTLRGADGERASAERGAAAGHRDGDGVGSARRTRRPASPPAARRTAGPR